MRIIKSFLSVRELFFPLISWFFIFLAFFSFSWFFNEPVNPIIYLLVLAFLLCSYLGYYFVGRYDDYSKIEIKKKLKFNVLLPAILGCIPVLIYFTSSLGNIGKNLSSIREEHFEQGVKSGIENVYILTFPIFIISFILANFNNLRYKWIINLLALFTCLAFIPINGGRTNFLIFINIYMAIYLFKNFDKLKKRPVSYFFKFCGLFLLMIIAFSIFSITRVGAENENMIANFNRLKFINSGALNNLAKIPNGVGVILAIFIYVFYDYTGGNVYYFSIFYDNADKLNAHTYGIYNFSLFERFTTISWADTHFKIDKLYLKSDIKYNVWATALRDLYVDFGFTGTFIFVFILSVLFFSSRKFLYQSYSAQSVFFLSFAFFLFAPFHSIFYITPIYGLAFIISIVLFFRFLIFKRKPRRHFVQIHMYNQT